MALLKHPAGFYVDTEKLAALAGTTVTPGFALVSIWSGRYEGNDLKQIKSYSAWAQVNRVQSPDGVVATMQSGKLLRDGVYHYGSACYVRTDYTVPNEQNPALALKLDYYRRECVVTPAQMALEQLRRRLDNAQL